MVHHQAARKVQDLKEVIQKMSLRRDLIFLVQKGGFQDIVADLLQVLLRMRQECLASSFSDSPWA